jgi:vesicle transport through interaction with t-SNAREs protein 1
MILIPLLVVEGRQKETIQRSRGRLRDVEAGLGQSSTLVSRMIFRAQQNKIILLLLAVFIFLILVFGIYRLATRH